MPFNSIVRALATLCVVILLAASGPSHASEEQGLTVAKLEDWLTKYGEAWETRSAKKAGKLFTTDATYRESPYDAPFEGRKAIQDYWSGVTKDQSDIEFTAEALAVSGNRGIAHWHATFTQTSTGAKNTLDGIFVMEFAADGMCQQFEEWWHFKSEEASKASN
jgi:nuclear transport factor 2 (NTF2) superfamily protein